MPITNAKDYLEQRKTLDMQIECAVAELVKYDEHYLTVPSLTYDKIGSKSNNNNSSVEQAIIKKTEYERIKYAEIESCNRLKEEIHSTILALPDSSQRMVLLYKYEQYLSFEEIAEKMNYSRMQVFRLHKKALERIKTPKR